MFDEVAGGYGMSAVLHGDTQKPRPGLSVEPEWPPNESGQEKGQGRGQGDGRAVGNI